MGLRCQQQFAVDAPKCGMSWRAPHFLAFFALPAVLSLIGYACVLHDFFLSDDFSMLHVVATARSWMEVLKPNEAWGDRWIRPLGLLTWWINLRLFGVEPFGYHCFSLAFHVLNAALLAWLVYVLTDHAVAGAIAGSAFAVLPNHPEAVTWISGRFDVLATTGVLVSLLAWTRYLTSDGKWRHLALAVVAYLVGLLSKEMALCAPLLYLGLALWYFGPLSRRAWFGIFVLYAVTAAYLGIRVQLLGGMGGVLDERGHSVLLSVSLYRLKVFINHALGSVAAPLNRDMYPPHYHPLQVIPTLAFLAVLGMHLRARGWRMAVRELMPFAIAFAIAVLPVASWARLSLDNQQSRYLYLSTAFSCAAFGAAFAFVGTRPSNDFLRSALAAAAISIVTWDLGLILENRHWHHASSIARRMIESFPAPARQARARVFVAGLPDNYCGAYIFRNGFHHAVELFTRHEEVVVPVTWPNFAISQARGRPSIVYKWNANEEQWR
jgi:hypothetical protein